MVQEGNLLNYYKLFNGKLNSISKNFAGAGYDEIEFRIKTR